MSKDFLKITQFLEQKQISLEHYQDFLRLHYGTTFGNLNEILQRQSISLLEYKFYLDENFSSLDRRLLSHSAPTKLLAPYSRNRKIRHLEKLGIRILLNSKVDLKELNEVLAQLAPENYHTKSLLRELVKGKKISEDELSTLLKKEISALEEDQEIYRIRVIKDSSKEKEEPSKDRLEFHLIPHPNQKTFGKYFVLRELGKGGMGIVYKVYDPEENQHFALKILKGESTSEKVLKRFQREVQTMLGLDHPGIIKIKDSGKLHEQYYFVMEYVDGESLQQKIKKELPLRQSLMIVCKILRALHYAHKQGVLHRDLKPENIFITTQGEPKIGDFGLAKNTEFDPELQKLTHTGAILGTPRYMSPEQAQGKTVDRRTDLYSIGACLYQILTHQCPHESNTMNELLHDIIHKEVLPPSRLNSAIHLDLDVIVLKALEKDQEKRYQSALEFAKDLERFLEGHAVLARSVSYLGQMEKWRKKNEHLVKRIIVGISVCLLFLMVFLGYRFYQQRKIFNTHYLAIEEEQARLQEIYNRQDYSQALQKELNFLNLLNHLLTLYPAHSQLVQDKREACKRLISLACSFKAFDLASYITSELEGLLSEDSQEKLFQFVQRSKEKTLEKHIKILEYWYQLLIVSEASLERRQDAVYALSKLKAPETFRYFLKILEEGNRYHLEEAHPKKAKSLLYGVFVETLGRLGNKKASPVLAEALEALEKKLNPISENQRNLDKLNYMVLLAQSLYQLRSTEHAEIFQKIRWSMGMNSLFWKRTDDSFKKLLQLAQKEGVFAQKELSLEEEAKIKIDLEDFSGAIEVYSKAIQKEPENYSHYHDRGLAWRKQGDLQAALLDFNKTIELNPKMSSAYNNRALVQEELGHLEEAIKDYTESIILEPENEVAYNNRATVWKDLGHPEKAVEDYSKSIYYNGKFALAYTNRALLYHNLGEYQKAINDYTKAIELNPKDVLSYCNRGLSRERLNDMEGALEEYARAIQINPQYDRAYLNRGIIKHNRGEYLSAIQDYTQVIQLNPKESVAYYNRALLYEHLKENTKAFEDYHKTLEIDPSYIRGYFSRGDLYRTEEKYAEAIKDYTAITRIDPKEARAYLEVGYCYHQEKKYEDAIIWYKKAIEAKPDYALAYGNIGVAYAALDQNELALDYYTKGIQADPKDSHSHKNRGLLYEELERYQEAFDDFSKVLELDGNNTLVYYYRGNILRVQEKYESALLDYERAIRLDPDYLSAHNGRGLAHYYLKRYSESIKDYNRCLELDPNFSIAYGNRGLSKKCIKDYEGALKDLNKAIEMNEKDILSHFNRGDLRCELKEMESGRKDFIRFLELSKDSPPKKYKTQRRKVFDYFPDLEKH
jgi:tetratricopeptide (TPR) repeat protein